MPNPYREPAPVTSPRAYCVVRDSGDEVIFFDSIDRVHVRGSMLIICTRSEQELRYEYDHRQYALDALRAIAAGKQAWEEHLAKLSRTPKDLESM